MSVDDIPTLRYANDMALEHDSDSALAKAVRIAGSQSAFGRLIGKRQSVIHDWLRENYPVPAELCRTIEAATGVSIHELRPDLWPIEDPRTSPPHGATATPEGAPPHPQPSGVDSHSVESVRA